MARAIRNPKIDSRTARTKLPARREPFWTVISPGCALGYRKGAKSGTWIARSRDPAGKQHYQALGAADDARDPDGLSVFSFAQAQGLARNWFDQKAREAAGGFEPPADGPYTVADALADYRAAYVAGNTKGGGKAVDRLDASATAWINPKPHDDRGITRVPGQLGACELARLTKPRIVAWHRKIAETPPRRRTKAGKAQKHPEAKPSAEGIRQRRSSAIGC